MPDEFHYSVFFVIGVVVVIAAKIYGYMRRSNEQWRNVDKTKLRKWEDEDD
jgi:hypothetical protein